jgi:hypothetical protein
VGDRSGASVAYGFFGIVWLLKGLIAQLFWSAKPIGPDEAPLSCLHPRSSVIYKTNLYVLWNSPMLHTSACTTEVLATLFAFTWCSNPRMELSSTRVCVSMYGSAACLVNLIYSNFLCTMYVQWY